MILKNFKCFRIWLDYKLINMDKSRLKQTYDFINASIDCDIGGKDFDIRKGISKKHGNIYNMPFKIDEFKHVSLLEVLEHLPDPILALKKLAKITTHLYISVPYVKNTKLNSYNYTNTSLPCQHIFEFNYYDFKKIVSHSPFKIRRCKIIRVTWIPIKGHYSRFVLYHLKK